MVAAVTVLLVPMYYKLLWLGCFEVEPYDVAVPIAAAAADCLASTDGAGATAAASLRRIWGSRFSQAPTAATFGNGVTWAIVVCQNIVE